MVALRFPTGPFRRLKDSSVHPLRVQKPKLSHSDISGPTERPSVSPYGGALPSRAFLSFFTSAEDVLDPAENSTSFLVAMMEECPGSYRARRMGYELVERNVDYKLAQRDEVGESLYCSEAFILAPRKQCCQGGTT